MSGSGEKFRKTNILFLDILFQMMLCTILFYLTPWFYKRGKNCKTFTDEGTDKQRYRHIYRQMECRWSEKFTWTFGSGDLKSAHIIQEAIGHFQTSFEKDKQLFFALEINATIHTIQLFACYFLIIDYNNVNLALKMPYRCKSWIIKINVVIVK